MSLEQLLNATGALFPNVLRAISRRQKNAAASTGSLNSASSASVRFSRMSVRYFPYSCSWIFNARVVFFHLRMTPSSSIVRMLSPYTRGPVQGDKDQAGGG